MKRFLNSWTALVALITSPAILALVLIFGLHFHWEWVTGYPLPIIWPS